MVLTSIPNEIIALRGNLQSRLQWLVRSILGNTWGQCERVMKCDWHFIRADEGSTRLASADLWIQEGNVYSSEKSIETRVYVVMKTHSGLRSNYES